MKIKIAMFKQHNMGNKFIRQQNVSYKGDSVLLQREGF